MVPHTSLKKYDDRLAWLTQHPQVATLLAEEEKDRQEQEEEDQKDLRCIPVTGSSRRPSTAVVGSKKKNTSIISFATSSRRAVDTKPVLDVMSHRASSGIEFVLPTSTVVKRRINKASRLL